MSPRVVALIAFCVAVLALTESASAGGGSGIVACPALSGSTLTNTLGARIIVYWAIGAVPTTISVDGTTVASSAVSTTISVILNVGETSTASQTVSVTEVCQFV